jgi:hypothetical protein
MGIGTRLASSGELPDMFGVRPDGHCELYSSDAGPPAKYRRTYNPLSSMTSPSVAFSRSSTLDMRRLGVFGSMGRSLRWFPIRFLKRMELQFM